MSNVRLIHSFHTINARLRHNPRSLLEIWLAAGRQDARAKALTDKANEEGIMLHIVDKNRLDGMTCNARHQGVAATIDASCNFAHIDDVLEGLNEPPLLLILDGITDPHNLGACLRVSDAMGAHAVVSPKDRSASINATVSKVACGAAESIPYITVTNLARTLRNLKNAGIWIAGTTMDAEIDIYQIDATGPMAWVMGSEGEGMRRLTREHCDLLVSIPMFGSVESLNVSVSAGIVLFESRRQRTLAPTNSDEC